MRHDLPSLALFVAMCDEKSLSKAAKRLNIAVSAASRRVKLLEHEFGAELVRRMPHGVEATAAGVTALQYAREVLRLSDKLAANLDEHRAGARGRVRIFASSSALVQRLAADIADFALANPDIKLDLEERSTADTLTAIRGGEADLGVIVRGPPVGDLTSFPYALDRLAVAAPSGHRFAARRSLQFGDLLDEDLVALEPSTAIHRLLTERARHAGRPLKIRVQVRSFEVMCQMVRHGLGVGVLPEAALAPLAGALGLTLVRLDEPWARRDMDVVTPAGVAPGAPTERLLIRLRQTTNSKN